MHEVDGPTQGAVDDHGASANMIVLRPAAEMMIKAPGTRNAFRRRLRSNVIDQLNRNQVAAHVQARYGRLMVWFDAGDEAASVVQTRALSALQRVFGIDSISPVEASCTADLEAIVETSVRTFAAAVKGRSFAVRCKRSGSHPFGSMDVEREVGSALDGASVDLREPDVLVSIEIDGNSAVLFRRKLPGPGGLPLGSGGRALALFSGGYDSAVAAWHLMKRGVEVDFLYCRIGSVAAERRSMRVAKRLTDDWAAGSRPDFHVVAFDRVVEELKRDAPAELWQVLLKRRMLHAAEVVSDGIELRLQQRAQQRGDDRHAGHRAVGVDAIVTGESVGQVSSQTLANLRSIDAAAVRPVLRPLAGFDKIDIMRLAERIGTAGTSAEVEEDCAITPGRTATASRPKHVAEAEAMMADAALEAALATASFVALRAVDAAELAAELEEGGVAVDRVPAGAVLLDGRPHAMWSAWHPEGARNVAFAAVLAQPGDLEPDVPYLLYCQFGAQSESAAEALRRSGVEAYSFRGGAEALRKHVTAGPLAADGGSGAGVRAATRRSSEPGGRRKGEP